MQPDPATAQRLPLLLAAMASFILLGVYQSVLGPTLPIYQARFGLDAGNASWLISTLGIGSFVGIAVMYVAGHHVTAMMALGTMAAGAALLAMAPTWGVTLAGGILFGIGYGAVAALFNARIHAAFGPRGAAMVGLINALYSVGAISAPLVFVWLGSDPAVMFWLIAGAAALTILGSGRSGRASAAGSVNRSGFRFHLPVLAFGATAIGMEVCFTGLAPSAMIKAGIPAAEAAALLSAFFAAFLAGRLVLTLVGHLIAPFALFTGAVSFTALCALGCALADPVWFYPPAGLGVGLFFPGFFVTATAKMGTDARVAPVILGTCQIGAVLAPLIVAGLTAPMGERGYFWLMAAIAGGLAVLALVFYRPMSRHG